MYRGDIGSELSPYWWTEEEIWAGLDLKPILIENHRNASFWIEAVSFKETKKERIFSTYKSPLRLDQSARTGDIMMPPLSPPPPFSLSFSNFLSHFLERENLKTLASYPLCSLWSSQTFLSSFRLFYSLRCVGLSYARAVPLLDYAKFGSSLVSDHQSRRGGGRLPILFCSAIRS